jgi:uncharacterized damage-inducible protein DinB
MSELSEIVEELKRIHSGDAWHGPSLHESLDGLTPEQAAAKPIPGVHSIWEIVSHIAGWEAVFRRRLEGDGKAISPEAGDFPAVIEVSEAAWTRTLDSLERGHDRLLTVVSVLSDEALEQTVAAQEYSVRFLLRGIVRHHVYHAGQVTLLRKSLG